MIETGLNKREIGKLILGACFVTDLGTVLALGVMFAHYDGWLAVFLGASAIIMPFASKFTEGFLRRFDGQVSEPEIKFLGVLPMTRVFRMDRKTGAYTTLLMSTGLTFGTISAMFGLSRGLITPFEYSALVTTVIASAVVPTLIAQRHFRPRPPAIAVQAEDEALVLAERPDDAGPHRP